MKRAYRRKYHYIYKTTCKVTGKYYIGMHSTDNLNDGYVGSGKRLGYSIRKYGIENHICEILEHYFTREWLREREAELVCVETLTDPMCMNLKLGGEGGWENVNSKRTADEHRRISSDGGKLGASRSWANISSDEEKLAKHIARATNNIKSAWASGKITAPTFAGKTHTAESIAKMKAAKIDIGLGESNSQYGTCWISNGVSARKIHKEALNEWLAKGWRAGRK